MFQYIIVILIGIAIAVFVAKRIYQTFFRKNKPVSLCDDCPGCALKTLSWKTFPANSPKIKNKCIKR
jgi:hypothetical protein